MSTLTLTFSKATAIEAVKSDTYITSSVDRGADSVKNAGIAYNEAAGDDAHHEKKIERLIREAVSKFAAELAEFVDSASGSITTTIDTNITITMTVTSRYLSGLANPLSGIALSYVVNMSLYGWWISIKPEMAKNFAALATDALVYLRKCFAKKAPSVAGSSYDDVTGRIDDDPSPTPGPSPDPDPDPDPSITTRSYNLIAIHTETGSPIDIDGDGYGVPAADAVGTFGSTYHEVTLAISGYEGNVDLYTANDDLTEASTLTQNVSMPHVISQSEYETIYAISQDGNLVVIPTRTTSNQLTMSYQNS
jgi:hypothetical protein